MTNESSNQISLTDQELQRRSQCALYVPTELDPLQGPADAIDPLGSSGTSRQVRSAKTGGTREHFTVGWMKAWKQARQDRGVLERPKNAAGFARRVYVFLLKHEVIHPFEPYTLQLDSGKVTGENAVVLWRSNTAMNLCQWWSIRFLRRPRRLCSQTMRYWPSGWPPGRTSIPSIWGSCTFLCFPGIVG